MRNIPTVTRNLLIINTLCYLVTVALEMVGIDLTNMFGLHFMLAHNFWFFQLFTYMFMHGGFTHLLFNMFALWMFGCVIEQTWGARRFLAYYLTCGIGAGLFQEVAQLAHFYMLMSDNGYGLSTMMQVAQANARVLDLWTTVGASGAIYGILLAFGMVFPENRVFIFPLPIPIKAKWFVAFYAIIELTTAFAMPGDGVAHVAHLGGMAVGWFLIRYWRRHAPTVGFGSGHWQNTHRGGSWFSNLFKGGKKTTQQGPMGGGYSQTTTHDERADWDYNARKKAAQAETDRILDKIRRSGYDSLTAAEKEHLFNNRN